MEVEAKYHVDNTENLERALKSAGAVFLSQQKHCDTYFRHPCRDFRATDEALRIRVVDDIPWITYKGPRQTGSVKVRPEIELALGSRDLQPWFDVWTALGFEPLATVAKVRRCFQVPTETRTILVSIDTVQSLGDFAEIERVVHSAAEVDQAKMDILYIAAMLGLHREETRSYLAMVLTASGQ
jgi:adenylate cyclase class 2